MLANNLPIASGVVLVDRNRIAVEVKQMLPKLPGTPLGRAKNRWQNFGIAVSRRSCPPMVDLLHRRR